MLAAVVGAVAGVLVAPVIFLSSKMGLVVINGFTAAVLGGFGSMPGAVVGGMLLGVLENLAPALPAHGASATRCPSSSSSRSCSCAPPVCWAASSGGRYEGAGRAGRR